MMACMSCTEQPVKEDFITDCEKSNFVKTPRFAETMAYFEKLADGLKCNIVTYSAQSDSSTYTAKNVGCVLKPVRGKRGNAANVCQP